MNELRRLWEIVIAILLVVGIGVGIATYDDGPKNGGGHSYDYGDPRECSPGARVAVECN